MKVWKCDRCPWTGESADDIAVLFHRCDAGHRLGGIRQLPTKDEDRTEWARRKLGELAGAFETAVGEEALRRHIDQDDER